LKLSLHCMGGSDKVRLFYGRSPVFKLVNGTGQAAEIRQANPQAFIIGRRYVADFDPNDLYARGADPADEALKFFGLYNRDQALESPDVDAWEGPNEPKCTSPESGEWYGRFEYERAKLLRSIGRRAVVGNFATGVPSLPQDDTDVAKIGDFGWLVRAVVEFGSKLGLHEYGGLDRRLDSYLLYRSVRWLMVWPELYPIPSVFVITEAGTDSTPGNPPGRPWKSKDEEGRQYLTEDQYALYLHRYNAEIRTDRHYSGATIFTGGTLTFGWDDFQVEHDQVIDKLVAMPTVDVPDAPLPKKLKGLVGLHGRADGRMQEADFETVRLARLDAVKLLSSAALEDVDRLMGYNPNMLVLVRLFADFSNRIVSPETFLQSALPEAQAFYAKGVRFFEIHNEPNLTVEGLGRSWNNGSEFSQWFRTVYDTLKQALPLAFFGFPGVSPGKTIAGVRMDEITFLSQAAPAINIADWLGGHFYWQTESERVIDVEAQLQRYNALAKDKLLWATEFSNSNALVDHQSKAQQYLSFYQQITKHDRCAGAFAFVSSASVGFKTEVWRDEQGRQTVIPSIVGNREVVTMAQVLMHYGYTAQTAMDDGTELPPALLTTFEDAVAYWNEHQTMDGFRTPPPAPDWPPVPFRVEATTTIDIYLAPSLSASKWSASPKPAGYKMDVIENANGWLKVHPAPALYVQADKSKLKVIP